MRVENKGKKVNVILRLSRTNQDSWCLDLEDIDSHLLISRMFIPDKEIPNLISTRPTVGTAELFTSENFGKRLEVKSVLLDLVYAEEGLFELEARVILWESQNPEWKIDTIKNINWQKRRPNNKYEVMAR